MRIAYIISAYKNADQLVRLLHKLNTSNAFFFVHVDKKTKSPIYHTMVEGVRDLENVSFLKRHKCYWGDFGHVLATLKGINALIESKINFDYVILLTGQDYPIKSNLYINRFLKENMGKQYLEHFELPVDGWGRERGGLERIETWNFRLFGKLCRIRTSKRPKSWIKACVQRVLNSFLPPRRFPTGFKPFGGSGYWCVTRECAHYIYHFVKTNSDFLDFFKFSYIPDELVFQTIILNSYLKGSVVSDNLRCLDWSSGGPGDSVPRIWCKQDLSVLLDSKALFARKFDTAIDSEILDLIDCKLLEYEANLS